VQCVIRGCYEDDDFNTYFIAPVTVDCVFSKWLYYGNIIVLAGWRKSEWKVEKRRKGKRESSDGQTDRQND